MLAATKTKAFRKGPKKDDALGFRRETAAVYVAGRVIRGGRVAVEGGGAKAPASAGPLTAKALRRLVEIADEASKRLGAAIVAVPAGDPVEAEAGLDVLIGIRGFPASSEEPGPVGPVRLDDLRALVADATTRLDAAFWLAVGGALDPAREGLLADATTALHFAATGPRATGWLGFGIEARGEREGYAFFRGADMEGGAHPLGVLGVTVAEVGGALVGSAVIDLGEEAHVARAAATKGLDGTLGYWLSARHG